MWVRERIFTEQLRAAERRERELLARLAELESKLMYVCGKPWMDAEPFPVEPPPDEDDFLIDPLMEVEA